MLNEVYVKESNNGAVMGALLLFVSFTIAPKFIIEKHSLFTLWKCDFQFTAKTKRYVQVWDSFPYPTDNFFIPTLSVCTDGLSAVRQRDNQIFSDESFPISLAMRISCARAKAPLSLPAL